MKPKFELVKYKPNFPYPTVLKYGNDTSFPSLLAEYRKRVKQGEFVVIKKRGIEIVYPKLPYEFTPLTFKTV